MYPGSGITEASIENRMSKTKKITTLLIRKITIKPTVTIQIQAHNQTNLKVIKSTMKIISPTNRVGTKKTI